MRYGIDDISSSPVAAAVFLLGLGVALFAFLTSDGAFGTRSGSPEWWLGLAAAALAVTLFAVRLLR